MEKFSKQDKIVLGVISIVVGIATIVMMNL